jgi:soluble lytic murein transglycosylase
MYSFIYLIFFLFMSPMLSATPQQDYLNRFHTYLELNRNLLVSPPAAFYKFIQTDTPLANKLREKWLILLGQKKDWKTFKQYYKQSNHTSLACYAAIADYYSGQQTEAMNAAKSLWINGQSQPGACRELFELLLKQPDFDERYIDARIILALNANNIPLVTFLLKQYHSPKTADVILLNNIIKRPALIATLPSDQFHGYFYVYGLKRLVAQKQKEAISLWHAAQQSHRLIESQQQQFLTYLALYKSMRNEDDAVEWFAQVKPAYYNDTLLDWQIRLALKQLDWKKVEQLIHYYQNQSDVCWQYWLARALEAQGKTQEARTLYQQLAQSRQYYGFLASARLNQPLQFEPENSNVDLSALKSYQPITDQISTLHQLKRDGDASQLLNDFTSELPKDEKVTLIHWVAGALKWYSKSIAMSSGDDLKNHLVLRFPLAYRQLISAMSSSHHLPEAFIYAIIRQESAFNSNIVSPAGAKGLMQLMPGTASLMAKNNHVHYGHSKAALFYSPTNVNLGSAYLATLAHRFNNHPVLMAAAYNAGPTQVFYWLKNHPPHDMDIWVETLPWRETRNYLKNVIAFYAVYQYRIQAHADIEHVIKPIQPL